MGMGLGGLGRLGKLGMPAPSQGVGDIITSIFADGTDGFYFDFSKTDRLFQAVNSGVLADDAGENIALALESSKWGGRTTLAQEIAFQAELFPDGGIPNTTGWTGANATLTAEANGLKLLSTASGAAARTAYKQFDNLTIGRWYYAELSVTEVGGTASGAITLLMQITTLAGASIQNSLSPTGTGTRLAWFQATATSHRVVCRFDGSGADTTTYAIFDNISVKEVPRNHGVQTTTSAQPKWQTGGLARFDGSDDNLLTAFTPGASHTFIAKFKLTAPAGTGVGVIMGSRDVSTTRGYLSINGSGHSAGVLSRLSAGVGTDGNTAIYGGGDISGVTGVGALTYSGSAVKLYWNGVEVYSAAQNGSTTTTIPTRVGGLNDNGTAGAFATGDVYHALGIKKVLTAAEIAAITTKWGTS